MEILRASPEDVETLRSISIRSKGYWGYSEAMMARFAETMSVTLASLASDVVCKACVGTDVVGWYRLVEENNRVASTFKRTK